LVDFLASFKNENIWTMLRVSDSAHVVDRTHSFNVYPYVIEGINTRALICSFNG